MTQRFPSMRPLVAALASLVWAMPANAQVTFSNALVREMQQVQEAALKSDYAYRQVAYLCNNIGPRLSGSPQAQTAVEYVAAEMKRLGLEITLEKVQVPHWVRGIETAALTQFQGQAPGTTQKIVLTALGGSVATPESGLSAPVVVVNDFAELESLDKEKIAGNIVLFNHSFDQQLAATGFGLDAYGQAVGYRGSGASAAARLGAVASLVRSVGGATYRLPHTGALRYAQDAPKIPAAAVAAEDADLIARLSTQGPVRLQLTLTPKTLPDTTSYNVIADLKGSEHPEEIVIVSGHLDSWDLGTGALDDASGVAVAMETAQVFQKLGLRPKRTLRVIAWINEENGLAGARTYVERHQADLAKHVAAIESDLGAGHPIGFEARISPAALAQLAPVSRVLERSGAGIRRLSENPAPDLGPLIPLGVPAFGLLQDNRTYFDYHHTAADTLDKVNPQELAQNSAVMAVLAYALTNSPQPLTR
ncbi:M20/M25/M40 family metallo-hydrolase [Anthocerotibacter panamensis]|uniref:M20/M25/M40 family metallo-hydrolase n=1 Tax=Anthocerotibacter panamensis TaxID=2857077 RepID=UPI001C4051BA|nr:M20/M25/M40 family metallo-hydrolase [Anthocerotibacter panamensis]